MRTSLVALGFTAIFQSTVHAQYSLDIAYDTSNFFDTWDFFNADDPTHGFVEYVDAQTANDQGLAGFVDGKIFMGVDHETKYPANGRRSVRLTSQKAFTHGLFIADFEHMPGSIPGAWPAFWMFGPDWPNSGEIDIIEGVNTQTTNIVTLHTGPGCSISNEGSLQSSKLKQEDCNANRGYEGCGQSTVDNQNYGDGFNDIRGGVYATEWTSDHIAVWFFHRDRIPENVKSDNPDPSSWGTPLARFVGNGGCNFDDHFHENNLVFDTTFCGDWAGSVWGNDPETSALGVSCQEFVAANPGAFKDAYWIVNSIRVFQQTQTQTQTQTQQGTAKRDVTPKAFFS